MKKRNLRKRHYSLKKDKSLRKQKGEFPLNTAQTDKITFSVLKDVKDKIQKIENISYEIQVNDSWEWIVRYDDHGGLGNLHRHFRLSLEDNSEIESTAGVKKYKNKNYELTWVCNDIRRNYLVFRQKFLSKHGIDLY